MSAIETASPRASWSASETAPRISEDWLSVIIGLVIFVLALAVLANVDLIGWVVTTSVEQFQPSARHGVEDLRSPRRRRRPARHLCGAARGAERGGGGVEGRRKKIRARFHRRVLDRLRQLGHRQLRQFRRRHAGRTAALRHWLVAAPDQ